MNLARQSLMEGVRALVVIALISLSFGHKPVEAAAIDDTQLIAKTIDVASIGSSCGDPAGPRDHAPCHACRVFAGLDLPPPPCEAAQAFGKALDVAYAIAPRAMAWSLGAPSVQPRGPPQA